MHGGDLGIVSLRNPQGAKDLPEVLVWCNTAMDPDKNNCCVSLWYICFLKGLPSLAAPQFSRP